MGKIEQATILILFSIIIALGLVFQAHRTQLNKIELDYSELLAEQFNTQKDYTKLIQKYDNLNNQLEYVKKQNEAFREQLDKLKNYEQAWKTYRDKYNELSLEHALLLGKLIEVEYGHNITTPKIESRKPIYRIGETIAFIIESQIPLYGSYFTIYSTNETLVWQGDPLNEWIQIDDSWRVPYYRQTAYQNPVILSEWHPLGEWTWIYRFGESVEIKGNFLFIEAAEDVLKTGPSDVDLGGPLIDIWDTVERPIDDPANASTRPVEPTINLSHFYPQTAPNSEEIKRELTEKNYITLLLTTVLILIIIILTIKRGNTYG